ncbi:MAG: thioredoxin domain-containing protein [Gemmatimonadales bacterium]|nr:thioredoxin domain-containing protein [Gemmatimonadales bacterium]
MSRLVPPVSERDHTLGPADARVTLAEYADFECPHCGALHPVLEAARKAFGGYLRFVFRHFPLRSSHPHALAAARRWRPAAHRGLGNSRRGAGQPRPRLQSRRHRGRRPLPQQPEGIGRRGLHLRLDRYRLRHRYPCHFGGGGALGGLRNRGARPLEVRLQRRVRADLRPALPALRRRSRGAAGPAHRTAQGGAGRQRRGGRPHHIAPRLRGPGGGCPPGDRGDPRPRRQALDIGAGGGRRVRPAAPHLPGPSA